MPSANPKRVLIIEPNHDLLASMASVLEKAGFTVVGATGESEAAFRIRNQKFACLVLSLDQGESALKFIETLRAGKANIQPNRDTPLILIGSALNKDLAQQLAGKVQGALLTPFGAEALLERVINLTQ